MLPARIPKANTGRPIVKPKREGMSEAHLALVRKLPCVVCGKPAPSDAHHLLRAVDENGLRIVKSANQTQADKWAIPLCHWDCHEMSPTSLHNSPMDEEEWLMARGIDGRAIAKALWTASPDFEAMHRIVFRARQVGR